MIFTNAVLLLASASSIACQTLTEALAGQNSSLSSLNKLLASMPEVSKLLNEASNITLLAPNNAAIEAFLNATGTLPDRNTTTALLQYHVLRGTYYASALTASSKPQFIPTALEDRPHFARVKGGQRVEAMSKNGTVVFYSGLGLNSTVVTPNLNFTGGTIHVIDHVLTLPLNDTETFVAANLTAAAGALNSSGLAGNLTQARDVTIFAPSNEAFAAIGSVTANLSTDQLGAILKYHVVPNTVAYSTDLVNGTVVAVDGQKLTITVFNSTIFVNSAKVIAADVLVANGVVHIIDNVLNPSNTTGVPNPTGSNAPAFSGASTASGGVPFTSGVATPTSTAPIATHTGTSTSSGAGVPRMTAAVGAAALFGGAALLVNL